jgi:hypothetical protein
VLIPKTRCGCGLNCDPAFLLLLHEIRRRRAIVYFADFMYLSRELENALGSGRFSRIYVGEDAYIPVQRKVFHDISLINFDSA